MKFSVLIPTRNRLEFLKYAIDSVQRQDENDFEIIVSDNFSEENIRDYVTSLNDPRIKYSRTDSFISVTDNWNLALEQSSGEWIIMLGDDDCLMNGYFSTVREMLKHFPNPDFIYTNGFLYAYPHVLPQYPAGLAQIFGNAGFFTNKKDPFWLPHAEAANLVKSTFNFQCVFAFNMQFALIHRSFVEKLKKGGRFYHSSYPDYYAMTLMMAEGDKILCCPKPIVGVGISPKSFGFYYFNDKEDKGVVFLNNADKSLQMHNKERTILPGSEMNNSWLFSLEKIKENFPNRKYKINYNRYALLQIIDILNKCSSKSNSLKESTNAFIEKLKLRDKCLFALPLFSYQLFSSKWQGRALRILKRVVKSHLIHPHEQINQQFNTIKEFYEAIDPLKINFAEHD